VRHDAAGVSASDCDGHPEWVEHQVGFEVVAHRPSDDPTAEHVLHGGDEQEPLPGLDVLELTDPEPVGLRPREVAVDEIGWRRALRVTDRGAIAAPPAVGIANAELPLVAGDKLGRPLCVGTARLVRITSD
jgi:hypothetical protein